MIFYKTLINIRKKHGFTQEEFAKTLGCTEEYIVAIESNKEQASFTFVVNLKDKLNLHSAPITESEREALMDSLQTFRILIDYGEMQKAAEQLPNLAKNVRVSYSPSANNFFDLFAAAYYWVANDKKAYEETMAALSKRTDEFSGKHQHYYHRLIAVRELKDYHYNEALKAYVTAEKLDRDAQLASVGFYYLYGRCLSDMGYVAKAIKYLMKAKHLAKWRKVYNGKPNRIHDASIDGFLANNLGIIGKSDDALEILDKRLAIEKKKKNKHGMGITYYYLGKMHLRAKNYSEALNNFDMAFHYCGESSHVYVNILYRKAQTFIKSGKITEGINCADEGLDISTRTIWTVLFDALKHSALLSDPKLMLYMERTAIPNLLEFGQHEEVLEYYELLRDFHSGKKQFELALKYSKFAYELQKQLYKELVEGELL